jgi:protein associated with RNAse G/E
MSDINDFTINALKADGSVYRSWNASLIDETNETISFAGVFEKEVVHPKLGFIRRGTVSYEFYWKNRWFNIFRFHEPDESGCLRNFYCNVNQPPQITNNVLSYVDLDVDVLVWRDFSFEILDLDEFERNAELFSYTTDIRDKVRESLDEILRLVETRSFPFNYDGN